MSAIEDKNIRDVVARVIAQDREAARLPPDEAEAEAEALLEVARKARRS